MSRYTLRTYFLIAAITFASVLAIGAFAQSDDPRRAEDVTQLDTTVVVDTTSETAATTGEIAYPMSEERKAKLISYSRFNHIWRFVSFFVGLGILALILFTGL